MNLCGKKSKTGLLIAARLSCLLLFLALGIGWGFQSAKAAETLFYETPSLGGNANLEAGDGWNDFGFIFTTGATTTNITKVKMTTTNDSPTGHYAYVKIRKVSGCAAALATSSEVLISATNTEYSFTFPNGGIDVASSTQYLLSYWAADGINNVEFRTSNGAAGEDSYWWSACSSRLAGNHVFMKAYWDPNWVGPYCGDATCNNGETFNTCPQDCPPVPDYCGDNICNGTETFATCPQDCFSYAGGYNFATNQFNSCVAGYPCPLTFYYDAQRYHSINDTITLTECESKPISDAFTTLTCASSTDIGTFSVPASRELYYTDPGEVRIVLDGQGKATSTRTLYGAKFQGNTTFDLMQFYVDWSTPDKYQLVHWVPNGATRPAGLPPATSTMLTLFGTSTHALACSEADWTEAASSTSWFNWTSFRCSGSLQFLDLISKIADGIQNLVDGTIDKGRNMFPFSIGLKVRESYVAAASSTLPAALSFLDKVDGSGNTSLNVHNDVFGPTATKTVVLIGPAITNGSTDGDELVNGWKQFTFYVNCFFFIMGMLALASLIYDEIGYHSVITAHRKHDYQL